MALLTHPALPELARLYPTDTAARALLVATGYPAQHIPQFTTPDAFWAAIAADIHDGVVADATPVVQAAHDRRPFNAPFNAWLQANAPPAQPVVVQAPVQPPPRQAPHALAPAREVANRPAAGFVVTVASPGLGVQRVLSAAHAVLDQIGVQTPIDLGLANDAFVALELPDATSAAAARIADRLAAELGIPMRQVTVRRNTFRDYFLERVVLEGPDERRFEGGDLPASTPARDVARGVMYGYYHDKNWPQGKDGKPQEATIDRVSESGAGQRLQPDLSLHENGVREGDTLRIAPQRTAGGVNPIAREEALARGRAQVQAFAGANPGFAALANSDRTPTRYKLTFAAPGFAPPPAPGDPPRPADRHVVLVELGPDYPMAAPLVLWQSPVFHPNIDTKTGKVCLGALEENYRPGLDLGELCRMLVDIASYRNYEVREGYNLAAQNWAVSANGQVMIEQRGGRSVLRALLTGLSQDAHDPPPLRIKPLG